MIARIGGLSEAGDGGLVLVRTVPERWLLVSLQTWMLSLRVQALSTARYWRIRTQLTRLRGASALAAARTAAYVRESRSMAWLTAKSFGRATITVIVAVALVVITQGIGTYLKDATVRWAWLPSFLSSAASWLGQPPPPNMNYQAVVTAALAVTGTLAGVYFATVAFVVSTTYRDATSRVQALVTRLPGGRLYAFVFVQAVLFGLITLTLPMTGHEPNRLLLCVITVLGGFVLLSFGRLRIQLYGLLEPVGLVPIVQHDLAQWTAQAARLARRDPTGLRTRLCRARTLESLLALQDICHLVRDRERTGAHAPAEYVGTDPRVLSATRYILAIWMQYARRKQQLVQLSDWHFQRTRHKDWLLASNNEVGIALATYTTLQATATDDALWVERHLAQILGELVSGRDLPQLASILGGLDDPVRELVSRGMFAESRLWTETVVSPTRAVTMRATRQPLPDPTDKESNHASTTPADTLRLDGHLYNLVDFVALAYTQAVLGLYDYAHTLTLDFPNWMVAQARGKSARNLGPLPAELVKNLRNGLRFEETIEGHRVTSDANIKQLVARVVATETFDEATTLMATFEDEFWPWANHVGAGNTSAAGAALSRLDEALHKWSTPLSALSKLFEQCEAVHRDVDDRWPDLNLDDLAARRTALQDQLRAPIARLATRIEIERDPNRPDVFGWAFYRAHDDLLEDVLSDRTTARHGIEERLRGLVLATDRASDRLRRTVRRQHFRVLGSYWSEPMLMLLQLSGAALVTGLARQRSDVLDVFEQVWGRLLDPDAQRVLNVALSALMMDDTLLGLSPGKINRSSRHQRIIAALEEMGVRGGIEFGGFDDTHLDMSTLGTMLRHVAYSEFEDVFFAAWIVPEARRRGAVVPADGIGSRLTQLIEALSTAHEEGSERTREPHTTDIGDGEGDEN